MLNFKKKKVVLQTETADQILQNVFRHSQVEPNSTPLEVLTSYSNYRKDRFSMQRTILMVIMLLFLMLPLLFVAPTIAVESHDASAYTSAPVYRLTVDSFLPVDRVTATINGQHIPVYEVTMHEYSIEPKANGRMTVTVTLVNQQQATEEITVGNVDVDTPLLISNDSDGKNIYLNLFDDASGIDFSQIRAFDTQGTAIPASFLDETLGRIGYAYPKDTLNIYIPDKAGNTLHLVLTLK